MREQIGWCDPGRMKYCTLGVKEGPHAGNFLAYDVPAFIDDGPERPTLLQAQVWNRILVNQQRTMQALRQMEDLDPSMLKDLMEACVRTGEILCKIGDA